MLDPQTGEVLAMVNQPSHNPNADRSQYRPENFRNFHSLTEDLAKENRFLSITPTGKLGWQMHDINPAGAAGDATLATAAKGQAVLDHVGRNFVELLQEVHRFPIERLANEPAWR